MTTAAENLTAARAALQAHLTGEQVVSVMVNGRRTEYNAININQLRAHIRQLEADVAAETPGAQRVRRGAIRFCG